jgi:hypothetical protein
MRRQESGRAQTPRTNGEDEGSPRADAAQARTIEVPVVVQQCENRVAGELLLEPSMQRPFLRCQLLFEIGDELTLHFELPTGERVCALVRVEQVHREQTAERAVGMALSFTHLPDADKQAVLAVLLP